MNRTLCGVVLASALALAQHASAQQLVIINARIVDGTGRMIPAGSVVVRDGTITSVAAGAPTGVPDGARTIDARGMTVMPGFIDAHRHIIQGDAAMWLSQQAKVSMQEFLDAGFTTVVSAGDPPEQILALRRATADGSIRGPRIIAAGRVALSRPPATAGAPARAGGPAAPGTATAGGGGRRGDPARFDNSRPPLRPTTPAGQIPTEDSIRAVAAVADGGFDFIKTVITVTPGGPETETLKLVVREGHKRNVPTMTHAVTVVDTLAAVEAGVDVLVHSPHIGRLEEDAAATQKIAKAGIPMTSTLAIFIPHFGNDNTPLFRDRLPFPWDTISSAGQGPVNARLLWEAGITSYGYGTDTSWAPTDTLRDELRALQLTFSPTDIVTILTKNAARSALRQSTLGTLETGKVADIVIVNGDPLANPFDLLKVVTTVKAGVVVADKRQTSN